MSQQDYFIQEYKFHLNLKTAEEVYMGSVFITFSKIPSNQLIILNCNDNLNIKSVRHRGKNIPFDYNNFTHTLHISCKIDNGDQLNNDTIQSNDDKQKENQTNSPFIVGISFEAPLNTDIKGFAYIDEMTAVLQLFPNFSSLFIPCDLFTSENGDISNEFSFKISDISLNITPGESSQIAVCSAPFPQVSDFIQNRKMFKFPTIKMPLPYFSIAIGNYNQYEIQLNRKSGLNSDIKILFFFDSYIDEGLVYSIMIFFQKVIVKIEKALRLKPFSNCIQIVDVYGYNQEESNTAGIVIFTPETLNDFEHNEHFIIKQLIKQFLCIFPNTVNENWIIEGLSSFLSLAILHSIRNEKENENTNDNKENENTNEIQNEKTCEKEKENINTNENKNENENKNQDKETDILIQDKIDEIQSEIDEEFCDDSLIEIEQYFYQMVFFRKLLNTDSTSQVNSLSEPISMVDDDTMFDSIYTHKSTCLFRMLFLNKTYGYLRQSLARFTKHDEEHLSFTIANFLEAFDCNQKEPYFESYFQNPGYPIIIVDDDLIIHQVRFAYSRNLTDYLWKIPLKIIVLSINENESSFNEVKTVSLLFDKKEINLNLILNIDNFDQKLILLNPCSETICRVWYKGRWLSKISENAENLSKSIFKNDLFNIFMDVKALSDLGYINKKLIEPFQMFEIPHDLIRRFPMSRGNGSILSSYQ